MVVLKRLNSLLCIVAIAAPALADAGFDALKKEFDEAQSNWYKQLRESRGEDGTVDSSKLPPRPEEAYLPRFKAYAEQQAGKPDAIPALVQIIEIARDTETTDPKDTTGAWAAERLARDHAADPAMKDRVGGMRYAFYSIGREPAASLFEKIAAAHPDGETVANAKFNLAYTLFEDGPGDEPEAARTAQKKKAEGLFRELAKDSVETSAGERAAAFIYEIENLQIGMKAPEIVGTNVDDKEIRLSQFHGQVVVLDFWGFW